MPTPFLRTTTPGPSPDDPAISDIVLTGPEPAYDESRATAMLRRTTAELSFDSGVIVQPHANGRESLSAGLPFHPVLTEIVSWPWVERVVRTTGLLALGVPEGESIVAADERRRLWALGVGALVCIPLAGRDFGSGALVFVARHALRIWPPTSMPIVVSTADTIRRALTDARDPAPFESGEPHADVKGQRRLPPRRLPATTRAGDADMVGVSPAWRYVMFRVDQVATTHATVLLLGETGTGKELVARAIHQRSPRGTARFVALNCSALPASLVESELFGHERGAFTGAHAAQPGRFELAHRGTLFLDEIGDLSLELQPKLLRVLQEGQLDRLGGTQTLDIDVRVIAATNRDLFEEVRQSRFRQDLFYRLNVFPITLPALRERREDIPHLAAHLAARFARVLRKPIGELTPAVIERLQEHDWPGNIRELENVIQRAIIMATDGVLSLREIQLGGVRSAPSSGATTLEEVERDHILRILGITSWRVEGPTGAAHLLGLKPSTLRSRLRKLGIRRG